MRLRTILIAGSLLFSTSQALGEELTFSPDKDSFLRQGAPNTNEGGNKKLNVRKVGKRRALLHFDLTDLSSQIPAGQEITSANLKLFVTFNNKLWTKKGRAIGAHMLLQDWNEGNGTNAVSPKASQSESENGEESDEARNRGSGAGVTWNCANDTNISNRKPDCSKKWKGGSFKSPATSTLNITNSTIGDVSLDVTDDVEAFLAGTFSNFGWLIKKVSQEKVGSIWVSSSESATHKPELVIETGYKFALTGTEEVPPVTTTATGNCTVGISTDHTKANVRCTHNLKNVSGAHIHDGPVGADGSVVCDLEPTNSKDPIVHTCDLTADLYTKLTTGALYINIHTLANPGGELRGQIQ